MDNGNGDIQESTTNWAWHSSEWLIDMVGDGMVGLFISFMELLCLLLTMVHDALRPTRPPSGWVPT